MVTAPMPVDDQELLPQVDQQDQSQTPVTTPGMYGEWNETMPEDLQTTLMKLAEKFCDEFKYPRRLEVMSAWRARCYWRELQHLSWNWDGECWDVLGPAGYSQGSSQKTNSAVLYSTNIFQGFGESFIAIITQAVPNVRFEPEDAEDAADVETARNADSMRKLVQHENDPVKLMTKAAFYAWTDGRMHGWTRWEIDKRTGLSRETQSIYGVMEVKVPVIYEEQCQYPYLQFSEEYHLSTVRAKVKGRGFPLDYWKKIKGGASGTGQGVYERTARISVKQGISMKSAGGDSYGSLVTTQRTWIRPTAFMDDCVKEEQQDILAALFPNGCYLEGDNGVYTGSRDANMDDEWTVENVMEGDGSYRNAKGTCLLSVQERSNDIINVAQDVYEKTQPASHWDDKVFDVDAMSAQRSTPGARYPYNHDDLSEGGQDSVTNHFAFEPAAQVSADMLQYLKELMTDVPEFLTGISAILFGSDSGGDKSGKALQIQQNAAMGRIGVSFRVMKRLYSRMMEQAVRCAIRNRKTDVSLGIPDDKGQIETTKVRVGDLTGNIRCFPDSDENYPESWVAKRNTYMTLLQEGNSDPLMHAVLSNPKNQNLAKKLIGLQELEIPDADSWNKQMVEINLMLAEPPPPPPSPQEVPNPVTPDIMETVQPPQQSSIPIDVDYDNHAAEFMTVTIWINSPKGQQTKTTNKVGFENVRLHGLQHKQALMQQMAAQQAQEATLTGAANPPKDQPSEKDPAKQKEQAQPL